MGCTWLDEWGWMSGVGWGGVGWKETTANLSKKCRRHPGWRCQQRLVDATRQVVGVDASCPSSVCPGKGVGLDGKADAMDGMG